MMNRILLGNLLSLAGAGCMAGIGFLKDRRKILLMQCVQYGIMGAANLVLGGITGGLSALVSIARNLLCSNRKMTLPVKLMFTAVLAVLSITANTAGWLGILPILSACVYTWFLDLQDERRLKAALILSQVFWLVYDLSLYNYVSFAFDIVTIATNLIGIFSLTRKKRA